MPESALSKLGEDDKSCEAETKHASRIKKKRKVKQGFSKLGRGIQEGVPAMKRNEGGRKKVRHTGTEGWHGGLFRGECSWLLTEGRRVLESIPATPASFLFLTLQTCFRFSAQTFFCFSQFLTFCTTDSSSRHPPQNHFSPSSVSSCLVSASHSPSLSLSH